MEGTREDTAMNEGKEELWTFGLEMTEAVRSTYLTHREFSCTAV